MVRLPDGFECKTNLDCTEKLEKYFTTFRHEKSLLKPRKLGVIQSMTSEKKLSHATPQFSMKMIEFDGFTQTLDKLKQPSQQAGVPCSYNHPGLVTVFFWYPMIIVNKFGVGGLFIAVHEHYWNKQKEKTFLFIFIEAPITSIKFHKVGFSTNGSQ